MKKTSFLLLAVLLNFGLFAESKKIITLGSAATEIVFELGLADEVVARDYSSVFPEAAAKKPSLGQGHKIKTEEVLKYAPTHVVVCDSRGTYKGTVKKIKEAGIKVLELNIYKSLDETIEGVKQTASFFGKEAEGDKLLAKIDADVKKAADYAKSKKESLKTIFVYARGVGTIFLAGENTSAEALLKLAGAQYAVKGFDGFKPINAEKIMESNPECILFFHSGLLSLGGKDQLNRVPGLKFTKAVKTGKIITIDDRAVNFGPRIGEFALELAQKMHGEYKE